MLRDDHSQIAIDLFGVHVAQAKDDDAGQLSSTRRQQLAKVEIVCEEDATFTPGFVQNGRIGQSVKFLTVQVFRSVPEALQKSDSLG